jgi:uncharacterized membrane protein YeaQ/YmgE (transglycosylase-associated protein family)
MLWIIIGLVLCAYYACSIAEQKQAANRGFWMGLLLGPVGVIAAGFLEGRPQCPRCGGRVNDTKEVTYDVCPSCRCDLAELRRQVELEEKIETATKLGIPTNFAHLLHTE